MLGKVAQAPPTNDESPEPERASRRSRTTIYIAVALALVVYFVDIVAPVSDSGGDTLWSVPVAYSVVHQRNVFLDEFPNLLVVTSVHTTISHGHRVFSFPWGPSIVSAPLVAAYDGWLHLHGTTLHEYLDKHFAPADLEIRLASFYVALTTALMFLLLFRRTKRRWLSLIASLIFAFGTSMLSVVSRALWSHTPSVLLLTIALYLYQVFEDRGGGLVLAGAAGLAVGFGYFVRPTDLVPMGVIVLAFAWRHIAAGVVAAIGATIPVVLLVAINYAEIGQPLQAYYEFNRAHAGSTYFVGLVGNLISPSRGVFIWSPFLLLAIPAAVRALRHPTRDRVVTLCCAVIVFHWLAIASLKPWWAGWSVGPRLFSDVLPFFMVLVTVTLARLPTGTLNARAAVLYSGVGLLVAFSLFVHIRASTHNSELRWNFTPTNVDTHSSRPWDWTDPQFLR